MKDRRYASRGRTFEDFIIYANMAYRADDTAIIEKQYVEMLPIRNSQGKVVSCKVGFKSTVDYLGRFGRRPIAIEAKHTQNDAMRYHAVEDHQARFLKDFSKDGYGISIVLISFNLERFFAIPAVFWTTARDAWTIARMKGKRKADQITITHNGQTWTTNGMASVKPDELLPQWEVFPNRKYGLHYLNAIQK